MKKLLTGLALIIASISFAKNSNVKSEIQIENNKQTKQLVL